MSKLLWHSNAPWTPTGYGQQTAVFAPRLAEHCDLSISAYYGLEGNAIPWNGIPVLPGFANLHGDENIVEHAKAVFGPKVRSGLVFTLMDVWVLNPAIWGQLNVASWVPVDHEPCPRPVADFFSHSGAVPIAMSKFGQEQLADLDPLYVPHGIDTEVYKPLDKEACREELGFPKDCFLVGMVAANKGNPSRKNFQEAFQAFKHLSDKHSDARLYVHTEMSGRFQGVNLPQLLRATGVKGSDVLMPDQYRVVHLPFKDEHMAKAYSAFDVLLMPSAGEGFGIPTIEAQACGVPVIVSNFSAQPELVGAGWTVDGTKHYTPIGSWQVRPKLDDLTDALFAAYGMSKAGKEMCAKKARAKAEEYDADRVLTEYMLPAIEQARERFEERKPRRLEAVAA